MKRLLTTALFCTSFLTPVLADSISFDSTVGKVTVFPQGAQITRLATGKVKQGEHVIIIDGLPGNIDSNSVRVEGSSDGNVMIGSIDVQRKFIMGVDNNAEQEKIRKQIEAIEDQRAGLAQQINNAQTQRSILQQLARIAIMPSNGENGSVFINAGQLGELLDVTGSKLAEFTALAEKARIKRRQLSRQIDELNKQLAMIAPRQEEKTVVAINLSADADSDAKFTVRYNVQDAGWSPVYDARLSLGNQARHSSLELTRRASVYQSTSDSWSNVKLVLSTARPSSHTQPPELSPYILSERMPIMQDKVAMTKRLGRVMEERAVAPAAPAPYKKKMVRPRPVAVRFSGFLAEYDIPGKVNIPNNGVNKNVTIGQVKLPADILVKAVPRTDNHAYLLAKFTLKGVTPYLPGPVMLSRDGVYIGKAQLPQLNSGEEHSLSFGRDDQVKITRRKVTQKKSESGFVSKTNIEERRFLTIVDNLHDFPVKVTIQDLIPYSTHEDIEVELLQGTSKPSKVDVDNVRGVLAWDTLIKENSSFKINFGYKVSWPKDMMITPVR